MALDPVLVAETRGWIERAAQDLRGIDVDLAASPPLIDDALFHCQQATEKSFKAFLTFHNQPFRRTHNLEEIGEACLAIDPTLQAIVDEAVPLTEYAWLYRYPGPLPVPEQMEAQRASEIARRVYAAILARIPAETHV